MIGQGQYGELQFGDRSLTWISSGEKTSKNITPNTSGVYSETTEVVNPTDYSVTITAASGVGDAIDISESLSESYTPTLTSDIGDATDSSLTTNLAFSPVQAIDVPLSVDALITQYNYSPTEVSELATSIQKAIGSEQYGDFQWGAISVGLPTGRAIPAEYKFTPLSTEDIGNESIKAPKFTWNFSPQVVTDTGKATEKPDSIPWNYGLNIAGELIVDVVNGQKPNINFEDAIAKLYSSAVIDTKYVGQNYNINQGDDTGIGIDDVEVLDFVYSPNVQGEIANTTSSSSKIGYSIVPYSSTALAITSDVGQPVDYSISPTSSVDVGTGIDEVDIVPYNISIVTSSERITVILNGDSTNMIYSDVVSGETGATVDSAASKQIVITPTTSVDIGSATDSSLYTNFNFVPVTTADEGWILDIAGSTDYSINPETTSDISSAIEEPESVGMTYEPILVISEGVNIDTILITHDYNSDIIHKK